MDTLVWILIGALLLFALYGWYCKSKFSLAFQSESFEQQNESESLLNSVLGPVESGEDKREWSVYHMRSEPNPEQPYLLFADGDSSIPSEALYRARVSTTEDGRTDIAIVSNKDERVALMGRETQPYSGDYVGKFDGGSFNLSYRQRRERITLQHGKHQVKIVGHGVMPHRGSLPHPWHESAPIVFRRGKFPLGVIYYEGEAGKVPVTSTSLALDIAVPDEEQSKLPLFFFTYVAMQEQLPAKSAYQQVP
jgi:hypothetical protein